MKSSLSVFFIAMLIMSLAACGSSENSSSPEPTPSQIIESQTPTNEDEIEQQTGIEGSYIKDIQLGVANFGMNDDSAESAPDGAPYRWSATKSWNFPDTDVLIDYSIIGDVDSQLISGSFGASWDGLSDNNIFIAAAETYLGFIATMPYDASDTATAKQWVQDNLVAVAGSDPISTTIGDAVFTISGTETDGVPTSFLLQISVVPPEE